MIFLYKTIINLLFLIILPFLPVLYLISEKRRITLGPRLGFYKGLKARQPGKRRVWIHALSVGEVISARPFVTALKEQYTDLDIVFTASTKTGFDMAEKLFFNKKNNPEENKRLVDQLEFFPFDLGYSVKKKIRQLKPDAVILIETDLWPNFLFEMKKNNIPVVLVNARLSKRSLKGYLFFRQFSALFFSSLTHIMAQTALDEERFLQLGIDNSKIVVTGNIKFDQPVENLDKGWIQNRKACFGIQKNSRVFIAGSTHEGEEKILCRVYENAKKNFPGLLMILAPRNPGRCDEIKSLLSSRGVRAVFMSEMNPGPQDNPGVILVDKMGELSRLYAICDLAFIGGSMVRKGGHNPLEAAAFSKPVLFGPDMSDFLLISKMLLDNKGAKKVDSESILQQELEILLQNSQLLESMGRKSFEVFSRNAGAVQKIIKNMELFGIV